MEAKPVTLMDIAIAAHNAGWAVKLTSRFMKVITPDYTLIHFHDSNGWETEDGAGKFADNKAFLDWIEEMPDPKFDFVVGSKKLLAYWDDGWVIASQHGDPLFKVGGDFLTPKSAIVLMAAKKL